MTKISTISRRSTEAAPPDPSPSGPPIAQPTDTPDAPADSYLGPQAILDAQLGAVGASFLRLRPWIVAPPAIVAFMLVGTASPERLVPLGLLQASLVGFFVYEAVSLARAGHSFVTPRRLASSLLVTTTGLAAICALTGSWRSPLLPLLLAPVGVSFAAFGGRRAHAAIGIVVGLHLAIVAVIAPFDRWPALPMPGAGIIGVTSVAVAAALLWAGVGALSDAHRRAAVALDRMRGAAIEEAAMRVRDLEGVGNRVAHEVKNPLSAVKAILQLSARNPPDDRARRRFEVALEETERMESIIAEYLSFSRPLDDLKLEATTVRALVEDAAAAIESRAAQREVTMSTQLEDGPVVVDRRRLRDALFNLLDNGLRACRPGDHLALEASLSEDRLALRVRDGGVGMTPADLERLGTPYFTTRAGGTGLGVVLARTVARQHGGDLTFESARGRGTLASLTLPRYPGSDHGHDPPGG